MRSVMPATGTPSALFTVGLLVNGKNNELGWLVLLLRRAAAKTTI
jgi:hypothetical protein